MQLVIHVLISVEVGYICNSDEVFIDHKNFHVFFFSILICLSISIQTFSSLDMWYFVTNKPKKYQTSQLGKGWFI